jgi:dCMP deaminase
MRKNRITWNDHHMTLAKITAQRSPDPNTQVGACIVDDSNRVISMGYNGTPRGIDPESIPWARTGKEEETKYPYIVHAERNAIINSSMSVKNCVLYVTLFPCNECAKEIIQSGIKAVYYLENSYEDTWQYKTSKWMLEKAGVKISLFKWDNPNE